MASSAEQLAVALSTMASWQIGGEATEESGILFVKGSSRFPTPYSNAAFPISDDASVESAMARAAERFTDRRYVLWARGEDGVSAESRGFMPLGTTPAMVVEEPLEPSEARDIELRKVDDAATFRDFVDVSLSAYEEAGLPRAVGETLFALPDALLGSCASVVVAYTGGSPAGGALSIVNAVTGVGGVYWVGTVPGSRRRGVGDAVTRFVTNAAFEQGAHLVALEASRAGEPVYSRMGYRVVGHYARFLSPKAAS